MVGIDGSPLGTCLVVDISAAGARLVVQASEGLPDQFTIVLSRNGQLRRPCSVVWRSEHAMGVKFLPGEWADERLAGSPRLTPTHEMSLGTDGSGSVGPAK
jgi:hypothetical protein